MAAKEALMAEEGKGGQATFEKNGEKVSFELEPKSIGLTKDQLEHYRNDPFWKRIRTFLFVLFWLVWIAMFAAAICIVVFSPKCAEKQKPDWWQTKASYQILTSTFHDTNGDGVGDFKGITEKLDLLRKIGITTIYPTPVISNDKNEMFNPNHVIDHLEVDQRFGTEDDFKELIEAAHDREMFVVIDLPVSSVSLSHKWVKERTHTYFITKNKGDKDYDAKGYYDFPGVPNVRYLGYPTDKNPVLNWKFDKVKMELVDAIKKYLILGVDGFHIDHVSRLAVNSDGSSNHNESIAVLKEITSSIKNFAMEHEEIEEKQIVLFSSLHDIEDLHAKARETGDLHYVIDTSFTKLNQTYCEKNGGVAKCVHDTLTHAYERHGEDSYTPYWQIDNAESNRLASRFDSDTANLLSFMQLTLPGALSLYYGQELNLKDDPTHQHSVMQWSPSEDDHHGFLSKVPTEKMDLFFGESNDTNDNFETQYGIEKSPLKVYQKLAKMRQRDEALIVGHTVRDTLDGDVILFSRFITSTNGTCTGAAYVVALNFGEESAKLSVKDYSDKGLIPTNKNAANAEVAAVTIGVADLRARQKLNLLETEVTLPAKQGVVFRLA